MTDHGTQGHNHIFLGKEHDQNERRTWIVIGLCGLMMVVEIVGGMLFGSIALVADGLHMSTHASALLLAALAYRFASTHARDERFAFGTGKFGDLAGFTSAIILAMIALLILYEATNRLFNPVAISFGEAIPIAVLGLIVNVASVFLLSGGHHHHGHDHQEEHFDDVHVIATPTGAFRLEIFEDGVPPRFRLWPTENDVVPTESVLIVTVRPDGRRQNFALKAEGDYFESEMEVPEPHAFDAIIRLDGLDAPQSVRFEEHDHAHGQAHVDNNMRAAIFHVLADAAVSVLVIVGLLAARFFGWLWMDPVAGVVGAGVIGAWSLGLVRATGAILLDMNPDRAMANRIRSAVEAGGDNVTDLHLWRLGPGHFGAILSIVTDRSRGPAYFRSLLSQFRTLSHTTIEVEQA